MARKQFTLVVLCLLAMCGLAFGQNENCNCYIAAELMTGNSPGGTCDTNCVNSIIAGQQGMLDALAYAVDSGGGSMPTLDATAGMGQLSGTDIAPNSNPAGLDQMSAMSNGIFNSNIQAFGRGVGAFGMGAALGIAGFDVGGPQGAVFGAMAGVHMVLGNEPTPVVASHEWGSIPGSKPSGIPMPENMRNFSDNDLILGEFTHMPEFRLWGGMKGRWGKVGGGNPDFIIPQIRQTRAFGGVTRFNLKGFSIKAAMDPNSMYYWEYGQNYTSKEYHSIITHWDEVGDNVLFYTEPYPY